MWNPVSCDISFEKPLYKRGLLVVWTYEENPLKSIVVSVASVNDRQLTVNLYFIKCHKRAIKSVIGHGFSVNDRQLTVNRVLREDSCKMPLKQIWWHADFCYNLIKDNYIIDVLVDREVLEIGFICFPSPVRGQDICDLTMYDVPFSSHRLLVEGSFGSRWGRLRRSDFLWLYKRHGW